MRSMNAFFAFLFGLLLISTTFSFDVFVLFVEQVHLRRLVVAF